MKRAKTKPAEKTPPVPKPKTALDRPAQDYHPDPAHGNQPVIPD